MAQSYLIFSQGRKLTIRKSASTRIMVRMNGERKALAIKNSRKAIIALVRRWEKKGSGNLAFTTSSPSQLFEVVKTAYPRFIVAGGGLVKGKRGRLLVIHRKGRWDLPKGKIEKGEGLAEGALREVMEETGLRKAKIARIFARTWHTYLLGKERALKETVWFLMLASSEKTKPQKSEGIRAVEWISATAFKSIAPETYGNILLLMKKYFRTKRHNSKHR